jgi:hypothetical protein
MPGGGAEAVVDHLLEGIGNRQGGAGRDQQGDPGQHELAAVGFQEGQQAAQGGERAFPVLVVVGSGVCWWSACRSCVRSVKG